MMSSSVMNGSGAGEVNMGKGYGRPGNACQFTSFTIGEKAFLVANVTVAVHCII